MGNDPAAELIGIEILEVSETGCTATLTVTEDMCNRHGVCHGGLLFMLADVTMDYATNGDPASTSFAAHAEIDYLRPAHVGDVVTATGSTTDTWGRSSLLDCVVRTESAVLAHFRGRTRSVRR